MGKHSHHSNLLTALKIRHVNDTINRQTLALYSRIFQVGSPCGDLALKISYKHMVGMKVTKGTIVDKVCAMGYSPLLVVFKSVVECKAGVDEKNGFVDFYTL